MGTGTKILEDGAVVDIVQDDDPIDFDSLLRGEDSESERASDVSPAPSTAVYAEDDPQGETFAVARPDVTSRPDISDATFKPSGELADETKPPRKPRAKKATAKKAAAKK